MGASLALLVAFTACAPDGPQAARSAAIDRCQWPMWGHDATRSFDYPCATPISPETVGDLDEAWFFGTDDAVTATPAIVDGTVYVGDWSGRFYAIDLATGQLDWSFTAEPHPSVYAGQIVSSAAVADVNGVRTVYFGAGKAVHALRAEDGELLWRQELGRPGDDGDPTEIESSPVVADGLVILGTDVHNSREGEPAGVYAFDAASGRPRWSAVTAPSDDPGPTGAGCADVWGSPTVDIEARQVFVGTGNCASEDGWGPNSEALLALDLDTGERLWGFQPHEQSHDDLDFAGAPNLFEVDGTPVVGLGNKDATYYVVDRATGDLLWQRQVTEPGITEPGSDFSTGGFIGPTALATEEGIVVGGTAVGGTPYVHALDAETGEVLWQQPAPGPSYAPSLVAGGVVFLGGVDYTFRAFDLRTGEVLWDEALSGAVSGGAAVVGPDLVVVAGMRQPGIGEPLEGAGVYRFTLSDAGDAGDGDGDGDGGDGEGAGDPSSSSGSSAATSPSPSPSAGAGAGSTGSPDDEPTGPPSISSGMEAQPCVSGPCPLSFALTADRVGGATGTGRIDVGLDPFEVMVETDGLGDPARWLRPGSTAAQTGATAFAVYLSQGTDDPVGGLVCVLDADGDCTGRANPAPGATYDRLSILAVADPDTFPSIAEGFDRLVTTNAFTVPFTPAG